MVFHLRPHELPKAPALAKALRCARERLAPRQASGNIVVTRVAVAGNCMLKPFAEMMEISLSSLGIAAEVWEAPFDQWSLQFLDPNSELYRFQPAFVVVYLSSLGLTVSGTREDFATIELLEQAAAKAAASSSSPRLVLVLPEPMEESEFPASRFYRWRERYISEIRRRLEGKALFVDPAPVMAELGAGNWYASRYWYHAKLPCHPNALIALGNQTALIVARTLVRPVKVIAVDFDGTVWPGVVGEVGAQALDLDVMGAGGPYIRLQSFLKDLGARGILLVGLSKNNEDDVREVFRTRPEMVLKWEDFTMVVANWRPKSANLVKVAEQLRLGIDSVCLIDDNCLEREEVRQILPEVIVPELPEAPEDYVGALVKTGLFQIPVVTEEDLRRRTLYDVEIAQSRARELASDFDSYLKSLDLKLQPLRIGTDNLDRVAQLFQKTNQFNLTLRRHGTPEIKALAEQSNYAFCYRLSDRFTDHGIIGVVIAVENKVSEPPAYRIDSWLMSCRVMGRTVEKAMFAHLRDWVAAKGAAAIEAKFIAGPKNMPIIDLLPSLGFEAGNYPVDGLFEQNKFVQVL
jgi:FkbH-like protein